MKNKKIIIDKNGVKEEYFCFYYDGEYESFKNIFQRCAPRIRLSIFDHKFTDTNIEVLSYDDGLYEFTIKDIFDIWNTKDPKEAFLKLSKTNCSYCAKQDDNVYRHFSSYLPFPYIIDSENNIISFDSVQNGDYLLIKNMKDYKKDKGLIFSCNGLFVDEVGIDVE